MGCVWELAHHMLLKFGIGVNSSTFQLPCFAMPRFEKGVFKTGDFKMRNFKTGFAENLALAIVYYSMKAHTPDAHYHL